MIQLGSTTKGLLYPVSGHQTDISRDKLANFLHENLETVTLEEFVGLITNKFREIIEYVKLYDDKPTCKKTSLLFNPHRLNIRCSSDSRAPIFESLRNESFINGLARIILLELDKTTLENLLYKCIEMGINGRGFAGEFPPHIARKLALKFNLNSKSKVLDPCGGWGGRMIGFSTVSNYYECFEPSTKTYEGLLKLTNFIQSFRPEFNSIIHCLPFEDSELKGSYYDFALTSPPYYNTELYSIEETNSCNRYKTFDDWVAGFYTPMIKKTMDSLKPGSLFILNIGDRKYPLSKILLDNFKTAYDITKLPDMLSNKGLNKKGQGESFYCLKKGNDHE